MLGGCQHVGSVQGNYQKLPQTSHPALLFQESVGEGSYGDNAESEHGEREGRQELLHVGDHAGHSKRNELRDTDNGAQHGLCLGGSGVERERGARGHLGEGGC